MIFDGYLYEKEKLELPASMIHSHQSKFILCAFAMETFATTTSTHSTTWYRAVTKKKPISPARKQISWWKSAPRALKQCGKVTCKCRDDRKRRGTPQVRCQISSMPNTFATSSSPFRVQKSAPLAQKSINSVICPVRCVCFQFVINQSPRWSPCLLVFLTHHHPLWSILRHRRPFFPMQGRKMSRMISPYLYWNWKFNNISHRNICPTCKWQKAR